MLRGIKARTYLLENYIINHDNRLNVRQKHFIFRSNIRTLHSLFHMIHPICSMPFNGRIFVSRQMFH